jgi:TrmH family RNA methyltransferase
MESMYIESPQNNHVKNLVKLRDRKHRNRQDKFIIEGLREIEHAIESAYPVITIYYCPELFPSDSHSQFLERIKNNSELQFIRMHSSAFSKSSYREGPDGLIALSEAKEISLSGLELAEDSTLLVLEGIEKPGNLGAIIRSAEGAGVAAILLNNCLLDAYNPNAIRASQGLVFRLPIINVETEYLLQWLKDHQFVSVATTPDAENYYSKQSYTQRTALLMGSESHGLSEKWLNQADRLIKIPMKGYADSLNVSVAAAICLYEINRQKSL